MFYGCWDVGGDHCHVHYTMSWKTSWNLQFDFPPHWWNAYCHVHCPLSYHGYWFPLTCSTGLFAKDVDANTDVFMVTRASRTENQGAMNAGIVNMLAAAKTAHAGVQEMHFLPFSPTSRRPTLAEFDSNGKVHRIMLVSANSNWAYPWDLLLTKSGLLVQMIVLLMKNITELIVPTDIL